MIYGTCNFESLEAAVAYYKPYGLLAEDVLDKLDAGEIAIGRPDAPPDVVVYLDNGRYIMETVK
ncbi:MAG TPA: hypothetical protein P5317_12855 [Myxococcota bacterium]|jgi:hypothetical protein|nr:hypothetical protein [Myxococcota bacterium]HRV18885.1 hypothetical protein [Myxococcota bacterium]